MKYKIYNEDVIEWAKNYNKVKFHALLCDPPYHLTSPSSKSGSQQGFMGQEWDGGDIAFNPETWALLGEHLYPGAFGMAFSASRNWHRLAVAIEDAGFIIHPTIFLWTYAQGFPKATNISKQIEKGKKVGTKKTNIGMKGNQFDSGSKTGDVDIVEFQSDLAKAWQGHRYGLQALKPAVEPIIVFQKPYEGKPLDNITQTGAGALNIDATRIPLLSEGDEYVINTFDDGAKPFGNGAGHQYTSRKVGRPLRKHTNSLPSNGVYGEGLNGSAAVGETTEGRWPANFILDEEASQRLDQQTGVLISGKPAGKKHADNMVYGKYKNEDVDVTGFGDSGGASRFFYTVSEKIDESDPVYYCSKASTKEKTLGLEERSNHPTHKPIDLCRYLAAMLLPPDHYENRTILIPFSGVGSEMIGAGLAGWDRCVGIEKDTEQGYIDIANKRLEYWLETSK